MVVIRRVCRSAKSVNKSCRNLIYSYHIISFNQNVVCHNKYNEQLSKWAMNKMNNEQNKNKTIWVNVSVNNYVGVKQGVGWVTVTFLCLSDPQGSWGVHVCCLHLKMEFRSCARGRQCGGIIHYYWWTASIKPRLLFSRADYASWGLSLSSV